MSNKINQKNLLLLSWSFIPILTSCNRSELKRLARVLGGATVDDVLAASFSTLNRSNRPSPKVKQLNNIMSVAAEWHLMQSEK